MVFQLFCRFYLGQAVVVHQMGTDFNSFVDSTQERGPGLGGTVDFNSFVDSTIYAIQQVYYEGPKFQLFCRFYTNMLFRSTMER